MTGSRERQGDVGDVVRRDADRVRAEYERRARDQGLRGYYDQRRPVIERASAERRALTLDVIDRLGRRDEISMLDVGCGAGSDLAFFASQGFAPQLLAGIDLIDERVARAQASLPGSDVRLGNAADLPYADGAFDIALQSVVLSSITDDRVRSMIVAEMARVVRPGGLLISYDMRTVRGGTRELVQIDDAEVQRLFGRLGSIDVRTLTLNIGIASRVGPTGARILSRIPPLRTHLLAVVTRAP